MAISTPLHEAVKAKNIEDVKALILNGAEINAKDRNNKTPIFHETKIMLTLTQTLLPVPPIRNGTVRYVVRIFSFFIEIIVHHSKVTSIQLICMHPSESQKQTARRVLNQVCNTGNLERSSPRFLAAEDPAVIRFSFINFLQCFTADTFSLRSVFKSMSDSWHS